jgi:hypothetical protein
MFFQTINNPYLVNYLSLVPIPTSRLRPFSPMCVVATRPTLLYFNPFERKRFRCWLSTSGYRNTSSTCGERVTIITCRMASMRRATFCLPTCCTSSPSTPVRGPWTMRTRVPGCRSSGRHSTRVRHPSPASACRSPHRALRRACRRRKRNAQCPACSIRCNSGGD